MARRLKVDRANPKASTVQEAAVEVTKGGLIAYPTDTLYGLGADALKGEAVERLFALKGRQAGKPLPVIVGSREQVGRLSPLLTPLAVALMDAFWPGPLTLVLQPRSTLSPLITGGAGVGVRLPADPLCQALSLVADTPLTATSANRSGEPPLPDAASIEKAFGSELSVILDGGPIGEKDSLPPPSTVVDARGESPILLREGALAFSQIEKALRKAGL